MHNIYIIGAGFSVDSLTLAADRILSSGIKIVLHTEKMALAEYLVQKGIHFSTLDSLYEEYDDFDEHAEAARNIIMSYAENADVAYCVFDIRDTSASMLINNGAIVVPSVASGYELLGLTDGSVHSFPAGNYETAKVDADNYTLVFEIDSVELAAEIKLILSKAYPDDAKCVFMDTQFVKHEIKLYELDRMNDYNHFCSLLVFPEHDPKKKNTVSIEDAVNALSASEYAAACDYDELLEKLKTVIGSCAYSAARGGFDINELLKEICEIH